MRKETPKKTSGMKWLSAASLAVLLAMFGCTSNQYAGNGQPTSVTPTIDTVNHSMTYGSSSGTEGTPPPMASSYSNPAAPSVNVDALVTLAADRGFRGYVLGPANPGGAQQGVTVASGQFDSPANAVLPQATVNSSINSQPVPVITNGDVVIANGTTVPAASPIPTLTGGTTTAAAATTATPATSAATVAGSAAFSPVLMNSTPAPQATGSTGPALPTMTAGTVVTSNTATASASTNAARMSTIRTTSGTANAALSSGIQLQTTPSGGIVMTNMSAPAAKAK